MKRLALLLCLFSALAYAAPPAATAPYQKGTYVRNVYSSTNVTTATWVQVISSLSFAADAVEIFDSSGQTLVLGVGAAASEVVWLIIPPGGNGKVPVFIPQGSRISLKALSGTASSGEFDMTLYHN